MAIYWNDKVLKPSDEKTATALEREYSAGLKKVDALFDKFRVKDSKTSYIQITRKVDEKQRVYSLNNHKPKKLPTIALPIEVPFYDEDMGATIIRYSTTPPQRNPNGSLQWATKYLELRENMTIDEKKKDLAWFMLFASNLVKKGVYQMVDKQAKYEGSFDEILAKKNVIDAIMESEDVARHIAARFISESFSKVDYKELVVRVNSWCEENNKWVKILEEIRKYNSANVLTKERVSTIEYDGEEVTLMECPADMANATLREEARKLNIKLTSPPQTKNVLYSLIQHVKGKPVEAND
jgi:hypothetical protein